MRYAAARRMVLAGRTRAKSLTPAADELRYATYLADSYRPAFDGMRGIGFLLVVTAHIPSVPLFGHLQGWTAVWPFLVMSGYLVTMLMMREEKSQGRVAFGPFLIKRFFRIVPSYWMTILIYLAACLALPPLADDYEEIVERLPYLLGLLPEYANTDGYTILTHVWTVGVEVKFYLLFPLIVFLMIKNANWRLAITATAAALLIAIGSFTAQCYCAILFGVLLALTLERPRGYAMVASLTRAPVAFLLGLVVGLVVMLHYTEQLTAVALVATYLVAYATLQNSALLRVLTLKPLAYLGQRSYGAYLLHFLAIRIGYLLFPDGTAISGLLTACFCLAITVPAAELMFQVIERPGVSYGRRLLKMAEPVTVR
jgi:peptidoglycan/LPS O-acetylase OafA/YrhL